jgi:hypothetical protein
MAMDGMDTAIQAPASTHAQHSSAVSGIFLHAGWRSCGTWMWERLRDSPGIRGFYEPLHEDLSTLKPRDVGLLRPDSWQSGHGTGAPYFAELAPLLKRGGGVRGHRAGFAFDGYFAAADADEAALQTYLRGLMASAAAENRLPVMKFCRSLGRVPWMEAHFPDVFHAVILRDPAAQWRSARRQMEQNKNRYFVLAPFIILARNADDPLLAHAIARLGVRMPPVLSRNLGITTDACWRHVQRLSWQERFRGFLALWVATGITSLAGHATIIDGDRLGDDAAYRAEAERALQQAAGVPVGLMPGFAAEGGPMGSDQEQRDAALAQGAGLDVLASHGGGLAADRAAILRQKLAPDAQGVRAPLALAAPGRPGLFAYADAAAYVAAARATYPLRRAHYHVRRWLGGI